MESTFLFASKSIFFPVQSIFSARFRLCSKSSKVPNFQLFFSTVTENQERTVIFPQKVSQRLTFGLERGVYIVSKAIGANNGAYCIPVPEKVPGFVTI